ncbi:MAG: hypothetical protein ACLFQV_07650 [Vulcanimicrobiota bacterium]
MTDINKTGSVNYTNQAPARALPRKEAESQAAPRDEVQITRKEESLAKRIIRFPGRAAGKVAGVVTGSISAPLHVLPGVAKGVFAGSRGGDAAFHITQWGQNLGIGVGVGLLMGGPVGAAIGGGAAAIVSGLSDFVGYKTDAYDAMMEKIESNSSKAISDNTGAKMKVAVQNMTEGAIIGAGTAVKSGFEVGRDAGEGLVQGVFGAVEGLAEGVINGIGSVGKDIAKPEK